MILVRHGATALNNGAKMVRGWKDVPLHYTGKIDAEIAAKKLAKYGPGYIFHSDFMRDSETAHIIAKRLNLPVEADYDLRTWDVGQFSGKPEAQVNPAILELYKQPWSKPPGSSESFNDFASRFTGAMDKYLSLAAEESAFRPIVLVCHGRNIALAHSHLSGALPWDALMPLAGGEAIIAIGKDGMLGLEFLSPTESVIKDA